MRHRHRAADLRLDWESYVCIECGTRLSQLEAEKILALSPRHWGPFWLYGRDDAREVAFKYRHFAIGLRFGAPRHLFFSERLQGQNGIPKRFFYLLPGKRLTLTLRQRGAKKIVDDDGRRIW